MAWTPTLPTRVRRAPRRLLARFWTLVDAEAVVLFQFVFGVIFILAGLYGVYIADLKPPLSLRGSVSHMDIRIWYWLNVIGPLVCLIGKALHGQLTYAGMWLQLAGDLVITLMLLAYITGTVQVESWGNGGYGAFLGAALFTSALLTLTRDVRRLRFVELVK